MTPRPKKLKAIDASIEAEQQSITAQLAPQESFPAEPKQPFTDEQLEWLRNNLRVEFGASWGDYDDQDGTTLKVDLILDGKTISSDKARIYHS